jgi:hypothetical protein
MYCGAQCVCVKVVTFWVTYYRAPKTNRTLTYDHHALDSVRSHILVKASLKTCAMCRCAGFWERVFGVRQRVGLMAQGLQRSLDGQGRVGALKQPADALVAALRPHVSVFLSDVETVRLGLTRTQAFARAGVGVGVGMGFGSGLFTGHCFVAAPWQLSSQTTRAIPWWLHAGQCDVQPAVWAARMQLTAAHGFASAAIAGQVAVCYCRTRGRRQESPRSLSSRLDGWLRAASTAQMKSQRRAPSRCPLRRFLPHWALTQPVVASVDWITDS